MSATEVEPTPEVEDQVTQTAQDGGSQDVDLGVDDIDPELVGDAGLDDEPEESEAPDEPEAPADDKASKFEEQIEDLKGELAERDEIIQAIRERMDRDPAFRKMLEGGSVSEPERPDPVSHFKKAIRDGLTPEAADVIEDALSPVLQEIDRLKGELAGVKPTMQKLTQRVGSAEFMEELASNGIDSRTQQSRDFQKHLKRLRGKSEYQRLESRSPSFAAEVAASKWQAKRARVNGYKDERARIESAKVGRGSDVSARSSSLAEKVVRIKRDSAGGHIDRAAAIRLRAERDGKALPRIEYFDD